MEPVDQFDAQCDEYDTEYDGQEDSYQQGPACIGFLNFKIRENEDEDKDVVYTERPFHQVCRKKFGGNDGCFLKPKEQTKGNGKQHPKNGLPQCFFHGDGAVLFAHQPKIENKGANKHNTKGEISDLINRHEIPNWIREQR